jgi:hypothetical protein
MFFLHLATGTFLSRKIHFTKQWQLVTSLAANTFDLIVDFFKRTLGKGIMLSG